MKVNMAFFETQDGRAKVQITKGHSKYYDIGNYDSLVEALELVHNAKNIIGEMAYLFKGDKIEMEYKIDSFQRLENIAEMIDVDCIVIYH